MTYSATQLQLTHVLQQALGRLGGKVVLTTGGSVSTVVDSKLAEDLGDGNVDDLYNGGSAIVISDAAGVAPEGEFSRITDYVASTFTVSLSPSLTTALTASDKVLLTPSDFPIYDMIEVVNNALRKLGEIPVKDETLLTVAEQTEYTLPIAVKGKEILDVQIQGTTSDANDNQYYQLSRWTLVTAAPGTAPTLVIPQLAAGYIIRVTYRGLHPKVVTYDAPISEYIHPELVHAAVMAHIVQWKNDQNLVGGGADTAMSQLEQKVWSQFDRARMEHPILIPPRRLPGMVHW